jgi:AraC-like DNA-binding protein
VKKEDGFPGQISFVLPEKIMGIIESNPIISDLYLTDIGYYPNARYHFRERPNGCPQHILIYCMEGQGEIRMGEGIHEIAGNQYFILPAGVAHSYHSDLQHPWSIYWIHFSGSKAKHFARNSNKPISIDQGLLSRNSERIRLFTDIFRNLERGFGLEALEYVNLCLNYLLASFTHLNQFREIRKADENDPLSQSINFMLENLTKKITLKDLSEAVGLSASYYSARFQSRTGHAPIDYFIQLKIQRACRSLDNSAGQIAEIANELGFEDQFYFSRVFRKVMGMSPSEYRKRQN